MADCAKKIELLEQFRGRCFRSPRSLLVVIFSFIVVPSDSSKDPYPLRCVQLRGGRGEGGKEEWRVFRKCTRMFYPYEELRSIMSNEYDSSDDESDDHKAKLVRRKHAEEKAKQGQKFLEQPQAFKIRTRYLNQSAYQVWWRPGIINKMLWAACETGDNYEIDFLVKFAHADINAVDLNMKHLTALMRSVMNGRKETAKLLIGHGANVNATDSHGSTALHYGEKSSRIRDA